MKKILKLTLVLFALVIISFSVNIYGDEYNGINYEIKNGNVIINSLNDSSLKNIVIPSTINSYPVTEIANYAFTGNSYLEYIDIPNSVTKIGEGIINENALVIPIFIVEKNSYAETFVKENNYYYQYDKSLTHILKTKVTKIESYAYTGSEIKPKIELKSNDTILTEGVDYTLEYSNNKEVGTGTIKVNGIGNYTGTKNYNFEIREPNIVDIIYSALPDNLDLNIKESEYEKANKIVESKILDLCSKNGINFESVQAYVDQRVLKLSKNDILVNVTIRNPYFYRNLDEFYSMDISIQSNDVNVVTYEEYNIGRITPSISTCSSTNKNIKIKYSNENSSRKDEKIDKIQFELQKIIKLDFEKVISNEFIDQPKLIIDYISEYYTNLINDNSIKVKATTAMGGGTMCNGEYSIILGIFKDDLLYSVKEYGNVTLVPELLIDKKLSNEELLKYVKEIVVEYNGKFANSIESVEPGIKGKKYFDISTEDVPEVYTIISTYIDPQYISIRENIKKIEKKDEQTNITLVSDTNVVPNNVVLEVKKIEENESIYIGIKNLLSDDIDKIAVYDINLLSNGVKIQPNGNVKIYIPIPEGFDSSKLVVYRVGNDGSKTFYNSYVENDMIVIETDHFSNYVVGEKLSSKDNIQEKPADYKPNPNTGRINLSYTDLSFINLI